MAANEDRPLPFSARPPSSQEAQVHSRSPSCAAGTPALLHLPALSAATWNSGATTSVRSSAPAWRTVRSAASKVLPASRGWPCMATSACVGPAPGASEA